jgi:hypothetical protein
VTVPSRPIRIAFAGAGGIARIHAAALKPATYRGLDELLQDARPDLVLVCTPPPTPAIPASGSCAAELTLRYDIVVATGELDTAACALLAEREGP